MKESNHTIDELKQEYEQIPGFHPHAKERILAGIAQGKAATAVQSHSTKSGERKKKSHIIYILRNTGATAVAAMAALVILTNINPTIANAMENVPNPWPNLQNRHLPDLRRPDRITLKLKWMSQK